ncbi:MAG TPA: trypsin-like serine protease [Anaerolineaceae bacterium]|nr:trypsin-like serine protease [Anaerolineaceae bacterium]
MIEPQPYPIEPQPYPSEEDELLPIPKEPFSNFQFDPSRPVEDILGISSTGGVLYISKELVDKLEENRNDDGLVEIQPVIPKPLLLQKNSEPLEIIGPDERFPIEDANSTFPFSAIVNLRYKWLDTNTETWCTGWLVGPSSVITAAHCLYDAVQHSLAPTSGMMTAHPGLNYLSSNPIPFGICTEFQRWLPYEWIHNGQPSIWDYGVVRLNCTIGESAGLFGFREVTQIDRFLELAGYPSDKDGTGHELWSGYGYVTGLEPRLIYYTNDTYGGQSGAPVWENGFPDCQFCSIAVHTRAKGDGISNTGSRVASNFLYQLLYEREEFHLFQSFLPLIRR